MFRVRVNVTGIEETLQFIENLPRLTQAKVLTIFKEWGQEMVGLGKELSPRDKLRGIDPRRRPEKESFALQWRHEVQPIGKSDAELLVGNIDPRMPLIIRDTPPRKIPRGGAATQIEKGYPMFFFWQGAPTGAGWYEAWQILGGVAAKGTKGQPVHEWIIDKFDFGSRMGRLAQMI